MIPIRPDPDPQTDPMLIIFSLRSGRRSYGSQNCMKPTEKCLIICCSISDTRSRCTAWPSARTANSWPAAASTRNIDIPIISYWTFALFFHLFALFFHLFTAKRPGIRCVFLHFTSHDQNEDLNTYGNRGQTCMGFRSLDLCRQKLPILYFVILAYVYLDEQDAGLAKIWEQQLYTFAEMEADPDPAKWCRSERIRIH